MALATDFNPGTSPTLNMQFILSLACTHMHMTPAEAIAAATINGAFALRRADRSRQAEGERGEQDRPAPRHRIASWAAPKRMTVTPGLAAPDRVSAAPPLSARLRKAKCRSAPPARWASTIRFT